LVILALLGTSIGSINAQVLERRAAVRGGDPNRGKCTIEVVVDVAADVEVRGDTARLRTLGGQPAQWRRFECSAPLPVNPVNFRFAGVDGRGRQDLVRDPRNGGTAVVHIEDPKGGAEGYTFDLIWEGGAGYPPQAGPGNPPPQLERDRGYDRGRGNDGPGYDGRGYDGRSYEGRGYDGRGYDGRGREFSRRITTERAVQICQDAVRQQASERFRTPNVVFRETRLDDNPGRNDWVIGMLEVRRYNRDEHLRFSCSVDFDSGRVRTAQIDEVEGGGRGPGYRDGTAGAGRAMESCQRAVEQRIRQEGFDRVQFGSMNVENRPGNNDWIVGRAMADGRYRSEYEFSCQVELRDGDLRSVDVRRR
jgi:hypothetical protein